MERALVRLVHVKSDLGTELFLRVAYEKLPKFCYLCRHLNHPEKVCDLKYESSSEVDLNFPFGASLWAEEKCA